MPALIADGDTQMESVLFRDAAEDSIAEGCGDKEAAPGEVGARDLGQAAVEGFMSGGICQDERDSERG